MNVQIRRLAFAALALLVALVAATTYWQTWAVASLESKQDNAIQRVAQFTIRRGLIYANDGKTVLAANRAREVEGRTFYFRRYPQGPLAAHAVGYSTASRSRAGLERSMNDYLTASNQNLSTVFETTLDKLKGATVKGNHLVLTLDLEAQRAALAGLGSNCGSAVAIEPSTGKVLVLASSPSYDPNLVERSFGRIASQARANCQSPSPLVDRATAGLYIPGSTFKVVTAAAALDSGEFDRDSTFFDPGYCVEYGKKVFNYADQSGPERFGRVNFLQAMEHSINAVFCEIGKKLGARKIVEYSKRFGLYSRPGLELPDNEQAISALYNRGKVFTPEDDNEVDPGRFAFGQERLQVTPLQMAMVAAGIANRGVVMRPHLVDRIVAPGGKRIVRRTRPQELGRAVAPEHAEFVAQMMEAVVRSGTGRAAAIPGIRVAGKTGTAETGVQGSNTTWFIAFAPVDAPRVAVAVALENQRGTGGATAAPIARSILQTLLSGDSGP